MAEITLDPIAKRVCAVLTDPEFRIVSLVLAAQGTSGLASLFASYIERAATEQRELNREALKKLIETATDEEIAKLIAATAKSA